MSNGQHFICRTTKRKLWDDEVIVNEDADQFECVCHERIPICMEYKD